jgi:hypothetical protein
MFELNSKGIREYTGELKKLGGVEHRYPTGSYLGFTVWIKVRGTLK